METMNKPLSEKHLLDLVKAGATIDAIQYVAGMKGGLKAMMAEGFVFDAIYLSRLPKATARRMGFKSRLRTGARPSPLLRVLPLGPGRVDAGGNHQGSREGGGMTKETQMAVTNIGREKNENLL